MGEIMKPPEVAKILGISQQSVREHLKRRLWDFGEAIPPGKKNNKHWEYNIYRNKLNKYIGKDVEEVDIT